jgi:hypothetical protein
VELVEVADVEVAEVEEENRPSPDFNQMDRLGLTGQSTTT